MLYIESCFREGVSVCVVVCFVVKEFEDMVLSYVRVVEGKFGGRLM